MKAVLKRALLKTRLLYRKWIRYINSPASTKKPTTTEFILLVAVCAAITIKFKSQIDEKFRDKPGIKGKYELY